MLLLCESDEHGNHEGESAEKDADGGLASYD